MFRFIRSILFSLFYSPFFPLSICPIHSFLFFALLTREPFNGGTIKIEHERRRTCKRNLLAVRLFVHFLWCGGLVVDSCDLFDRRRRSRKKDDGNVVRFFFSLDFAESPSCRFDLMLWMIRRKLTRYYFLLSNHGIEIVTIRYSYHRKTDDKIVRSIVSEISTSSTSDP